MKKALSTTARNSQLGGHGVTLHAPVSIFLTLIYFMFPLPPFFPSCQSFSFSLYLPLSLSLSTGSAPSPRFTTQPLLRLSAPYFLNDYASLLFLFTHLTSSSYLLPTPLDSVSPLPHSVSSFYYVKGKNPSLTNLSFLFHAS